MRKFSIGSYGAFEWNFITICQRTSNASTDSYTPPVMWLKFLEMVVYYYSVHVACRMWPFASFFKLISSSLCSVLTRSVNTRVKDFIYKIGSDKFPLQVEFSRLETKCCLSLYNEKHWNINIFKNYLWCIKPSYLFPIFSIDHNLVHKVFQATFII